MNPCITKINVKIDGNSLDQAEEQFMDALKLIELAFKCVHNAPVNRKQSYIQ